MNITKEEEIKLMIERITEEVNEGGGAANYKQISQEKLAIVLIEILASLPVVCQGSGAGANHIIREK